VKEERKEKVEKVFVLRQRIFKETAEDDHAI
jgi:hypothetical protein